MPGNSTMSTVTNLGMYVHSNIYVMILMSVLYVIDTSVITTVKFILF